MVSTTCHPQNTSEKLIYTTISYSWGLWLIGGLYIAGPLLGWALAYLVAKAYYTAPQQPPHLRPAAMPWPIWIWLIGMGAMLLILFVGHSNFSLGTAATIKSAVGWAKGWALLALFPMAGAVLEIRPEVIYRAICRLGRQTLILLPFFLAAPVLGLPQKLWVSPLKILGGAGDDYFAVILYTLEPGVGTARWQFFAPWSPAAGMIAIIYILCAIEERDPKWKATGIVAGVAMALLSQSRLALVAIAVIWPLAWLVSKLDRPIAWFAAAPLAMIGGWFAPALINIAVQAQSDFSGARADSSRVRATLGRIAVERWRHEAYWFGHGIVERGPHLVEYMPIGSHHSWYGLLFVKGILGLYALAIPMIATLFACSLAAIRGGYGRIGLSMALVYTLYSFGENLEVLTYICWPALVLMGCAFKKRDLIKEGQPIINS